jgi:anti-anti-sigma factor
MSSSAARCPDYYVSPADIIVVHETRWSVHILHVFADIDFANAPAFRGEITAFGNAAWLIVNLSKCNYIDLAGVRILRDVQRTYGDRLQIVAPQGTAVRRYLQSTPLNESLALAQSLEAAFAEFTTQRLVASAERKRA